MAKNKVAILSSNDITSDPRITRTISYLRKKYQVGVFCFVWPYSGQKLNETNGSVSIHRYKYQKLPLSSLYKKFFSFWKTSSTTGKGKPILVRPAKSNNAVGQISYLYNFQYANRKLAKEAIKFKPDLIHANDFDTLWAGYLIKKATGAKLIYDAHEIWSRQGQELPKWILKIFEKSEKQLLKTIDGFITVNESIKNELERYYRYHFKVPVEIIYNTPGFQQVAGDNFSKYRDKTVIFYHGGYMANRGLEELILAAKYLRYPAVILLRLTSVPEKLKELISKNKLEENVIIIPPVEMNDMIKKSVGAEIGVIPYKPTNINNRLALPNKVFEYQMSKMAIAASNIPELSRIITKYKNGITFNPSDPKDIAIKLNELLRNKESLNKMRQNSLTAAKDLNWQVEEKKLAKLYDEVLKEN